MNSKNRVFKCAAALMLWFMASSWSTALSQENAAAEDDKVLDKVTVTGVQNDDAMAAFRAGDFETAEVEFLENARCAHRRERNVSASINTAQTASARAETFANSASSNSGALSQGAGAGAPQEIPTGIAAANSVAANNIQREADRTCDNRGFQIYMTGLSQIQLGKTDDALRNFERATVLSKTLYDAHYKIALIKLLDGDETAARQELKKIEGILKRCRKCDAKPAITERRDHLRKVFNGEVKLR